MEWYDDPTRAQDEVRRAHWRGAGRMLGAQLALLVPVAILFPVLGQHRFSGPDKLSMERIAHAIMDVHRSSKRWPTSFESVRARIHVSRAIHYQVSFLPLVTEATQAGYAISVNRGIGVWMITDDRVQSIGGKATFGIINPDGIRF